jgi:rhodanese-related sulfurtransferase
MTTGAADIELEIGVAEAAERIAAGAQLVDVRQGYEWEAGRLAGSEHVPLEELPAAAARIDRERPIVFVCRTGSRSALATEVFRASGFEAYNLAGGLLAWVEDGRELEPADGSVVETRPDAS